MNAAVSPLPIPPSAARLDDQLIRDSGRKVVEIEAQAIFALRDRVDEAFVRACYLLIGCSGRVVVSGIGKSGHIARKIAATLASTGTPAFFVHPAEASHGDLGMITAKDVVVALSNSGETDELLTILPVVKRKGVPLVAMTGNAQSTLARLADVHLDVSVDEEACPLNLAPTASTTAALVMGDALAIALLEAAGWSSDDGVLKNAAGVPFSFEILLPAGATEAQSIVDIYVEALRPLGITPRVTVVDSAQYRERTNTYGFDMTWYTRALSLSPGNEQLLYWGGRGVTEPGSRNWMGMNSPAAEAAIGVMLDSASQEDFIAATHALDRILTAGRYVIPIWFSPVSKLAHSRHLHYPDRIPLYGDWPGFQPETWWYED